MSGDGQDDEYLSLDDYRISRATVSMRIAVERELLRIAWLRCEPLLPATLYASSTARLVASAMEGCMGDWAAANERLSPDAFRWLVTLMQSPPSRDIDWLMKALAVCLGGESGRT